MIQLDKYISNGLKPPTSVGNKLYTNSNAGIYLHPNPGNFWIKFWRRLALICFLMAWLIQPPITWWWFFQIFFMFTPKLGEIDPNFTCAYVSNGLVSSTTNHQLAIPKKKRPVVWQVGLSPETEAKGSGTDGRPWKSTMDTRDPETKLQRVGFHLKMDGWNTIVSGFGSLPIFRCFCC